MRPSEYILVEDEWAAYCFDRAVFAFGSSLQHELESVQVKDDKSGKKAQAKREQILAKWIPDETPGKPKFRDPGQKR